MNTDSSERKKRCIGKMENKKGSREEKHKLNVIGEKGCHWKGSRK